MAIVISDDILRVPPVGLGTWQTFDVASDAYSARERVLRGFVDAGGTLVDASPMYGRAEETVGSLAERLGLRSRLFLATKVWTRGREAGIRQMEESFRRLRTPVIDLMQVHNLVDVTTHLETLREWKASGRLRAIGITHYSASAHAAVAEVLERENVDTLQINYSVLEREAEARLLPTARERGIAVIANRPFAEGALLRRLAARRLPDWAASIDCRSWAELLLKFVISHPAITCAIPATANAEHLRDNMRAMSGPLPDADLRARIAAASR
jgi:aryl-alcohol dehydrogenase-like predicted oxidoreductase